MNQQTGDKSNEVLEEELQMSQNGLFRKNMHYF